jgi:hypothetical protein
LKKKRCEKRNRINATENCQPTDLPSIQRLNKRRSQCWQRWGNHGKDISGQISLQHARNYNVFAKSFHQSVKWIRHLEWWNTWIRLFNCHMSHWSIANKVGMVKSPKNRF